MFCPQCNVEYRAGFTRCSDCDVELVNEIPQDALARLAAAEPGDPNEDPFCLFWKGDDPRVHAEICGLLDEAGIAHNSVFSRERLFVFSNKASFEIGVPFSLFGRAEEAVAAAYGSADEAERAMHPSIEEQAEFQKLIDLPLEEKLKERPEDEVLSFWDTVMFRRTKNSKNKDDEGNER